MTRDSIESERQCCFKQKLGFVLNPIVDESDIEVCGALLALFMKEWVSAEAELRKYFEYFEKSNDWN